MNVVWQDLVQLNANSPQIFIVILFWDYIFWDYVILFLDYNI